MGLNDVTFTKGQGGLGRPLPGEDYVSGMLFYRDNAALPSGFTTSDRVKQVFSVADAETLGINIDYNDETAAGGSYLVTNPGATGDIFKIYVQEIPNVIPCNPALTTNALKAAGKVLIATYTRASTATTSALVAAGIVAAINAGTLTHGYSATLSTATVLITARDGLGVFLNSGTPITVSITGTIAGTITQFTGGVASLLAPMWYHISEYFREQPKGNLWVGIYAIPGTYDFAEVQTIQIAASGKIRQMAVYAEGQQFATAQLTALQAIAATLESTHMPLSILYAADFVGLTLSSLTDLNSLSAPKVSAVIGQDRGSVGYIMFKAYGKSITFLGAVLGAVSLAKVSEDVAWVAKFNLATGTELNVSGFAEGTAYNAVSTNLLDQLDNYRYIFACKYIGIDGTFINDSHTAVSSSSDYAYIENNRVIDKAIRLLRTAYVPYLNSPIVFNLDGTISDATVAALEAVGDGALDQMIRDADLSGKLVQVDPTQDTASTGILTISVELLGVGVARNIQINIGYVLAPSA